MFQRRHPNCNIIIIYKSKSSKDAENYQFHSIKTPRLLIDSHALAPAALNQHCIVSIGWPIAIWSAPRSDNPSSPSFAALFFNSLLNYHSIKRQLEMWSAQKKVDFRSPTSFPQCSSHSSPSMPSATSKTFIQQTIKPSENFSLQLKPIEFAIPIPFLFGFAIVSSNPTPPPTQQNPFFLLLLLLPKVKTAHSLKMGSPIYIQMGFGAMLKKPILMHIAGQG